MKKYIGVILTVVCFFSLVVLQRYIQPDMAVVEPVADTKITKELLSTDKPELLVYADGTYVQTLQYEAPYGHIESMEVEIVLQDGIVEESDVSFAESNFTSQEYQMWFREYYKEEVVGQVVEAVSMARVGGASLTNNAFDVALERVKAEASGQAASDEPILVPYQAEDYRVETDVPYIDGTYTYEDEYFVMAGLSEPMRTSITLEGGVITDAEVAFAPRDMHSRAHQVDFVREYKNKVIGETVNSVPFSRIGGASLTTEGFNNALQKIKTEAGEF